MADLERGPLLMQVSGSSCVGGFFQLDTSGTSAPPWIIGDTFLKNVYSVFRASPAAVGFAQLLPTATSINGQLGSAPSPTVGSVATVTGGSANTGSARNSNADARGYLRESERVPAALMFGP